MIATEYLALARLFEPEVIGVLIGFGLLVVVPIVGMFLGHQRRMAELIHGKADEALSEEIRRLRDRVQVLEAALISGSRPAIEQREEEVLRRELN